MLFTGRKVLIRNLGIVFREDYVRHREEVNNYIYNPYSVKIEKSGFVSKTRIAFQIRSLERYGRELHHRRNTRLSLFFNAKEKEAKHFVVIFKKNKKRNN